MCVDETENTKKTVAGVCECVRMRKFFHDRCNEQRAARKRAPNCVVGVKN